VCQKMCRGGGARVIFLMHQGRGTASLRGGKQGHREKQVVKGGGPRGGCVAKERKETPRAIKEGLEKKRGLAGHASGHDLLWKRGERSDRKGKGTQKKRAVLVRKFQIDVRGGKESRRKKGIQKGLEKKSFVSPRKMGAET